MTYSENILGKKIYDVKISDVKEFFLNAQEESGILEFKSGNVELEDIYKEVAAFLNTDGGLLIIGAPKEKKVGNKRICQGELTPSIIRNKTWLIQKISSGISPSPSNIKCNEIQINEDEKIYVLDISKSPYAPHQVSGKGQYYIRLEEEAKPAPHGIVEALFSKRQKPLLEPNISFVGQKKEPSKFHDIELSIQNLSIYTAEHVSGYINFFGVSNIEDEAGINNTEEDGKYQFKCFLKSSTILVKGLRSLHSQSL